MKITSQYIIAIAALVTFASCEKDNYDEPTSKLSGRVVYQGEALGFENYQVPYELYQYGFGKVGPIGSSFGQDGSMSAMLFDGEYKLIVPNGQGPFMWPKTASGAPDSLNISLRGSQTLDLEVMPYYMIRNQAITAAGGAVTARFGVEQIITGVDAKNIQDVGLLINKTQFVSQGDNNRIAEVYLGGGDITDPNNIELSLSIPSITPTQNYVFARVSVKIDGVEDRLYGPLQKISF